MKKSLPIIRRICQIIFLIAFIYLVSKSLFVVNRISPLTSIITSIASRSLVTGFFISIFVFVLTVILGRVFCGWVCPLGTLNHFFSFLRIKLSGRYKNRNNLNPIMSNVKYIIFWVILFASFFGLNFSGWFDPISISTRGTSIIILPTIQYPINKINDSVLKGFEKDKEQILTMFKDGKIDKEERTEQLKAIMEKEKSTRDSQRWFKSNFLYSKSDLYFENAFIHIFSFVLILLLNIFAYRFWCNYLCPLGGMLALLSRISIFRIRIDKGKCSGCKLCEKHCCGTCLPYDEHKNNGECMYCFNCISECKENAISVGFVNPFKRSKSLISKESTQKARREVSKTLLAGIVSAGVFGLTSHLIKKKTIRPPGVIDEKAFLQKCIRCGLCVRSCPANFLQLSFTESGVNGVFTPIGLSGRETGYCFYNCNKCGQVCPTGAIPNLSIEEKRKMKIGLAAFDRNRCLPWAKDTPCIICEEHCPVSPKAIYVKEAEITTKDNEKLLIQLPFVDSNNCIGCGICSNKCVAESKPAINVYPIY